MKRLDLLTETQLMGPGPSMVPPAVYEAMAKPTIGHLDPRFISLMDEVKEMLKTLFNTRNRLTIPMSGTGSAGMETVFVNLVEPGDRVLVLINGVFGNRMKDVATRLGAQVTALTFDWGSPVDVDAVKKEMASADYEMVAVVHAETSTGVRNPVEKIGRLVKEKNALYLVDAVTSFGGIPVAVDAWGVDAIYSGTQKCLSCPPGLSPVSFTEQAVGKIFGRTARVPNWYLDLAMIADYWEGENRTYHHTAPINMIYALYAALDTIFEEGVEQVFARHQAVHEHLVDGLEKMGIPFLVEPGSRLPMLNAVTIPEKADDALVRTRLLREYDLEIGAGLGPLAGKIWRIGLMGHTARHERVDRLLDALKKIL